MAYQVVCPNGHPFSIDDSTAGGNTVCPVCGVQFAAPRPAAAAPGTPAPSPHSHWPHSTGGAPFRPTDLSPIARLAAWPIVALGLVLLILSRGCESVDRRDVDRTNARAEVAQARFEDSWTKQRTDLEQKIADLQDKENPSPEDTKTIQDDRKSLTDLEKSHQKALRNFEASTLNGYKIAARDAGADYRINAYWWEVLFVWGAIILALGLLLVSAFSRGVERWVALCMIVIVTFSLFIFGFAWMPIGR